MNSNAPFSVDRDDRLAEVLDAYLAAEEAGTPPDVDEFLARYPELAGELRECLASLAFIRRAGNLSVASDAPAEGESAGGVLGDFCILREVGRGGMGVVYEAEQISLRRRVALKVLPFAATMDPRHLQRFHNEAQAAACLHHTNIVPVYFVGSERAVHFYAMQFIDGQPLSEIIRQLCRSEKKTPATGEEHTVVYQPSSDGDVASTPPFAAITPLSGEGRRSRDYFRKVAGLGVQAAEALDHAHQLGIVHRDIKPANLLLDARGNVWVTDFGLAHVQHGEASLTGTGQMVGTPRYMSPEQAFAKRVPIDHRTDVYSLGVTLYELLTLRPAFASEDRNELLRQIALEEPPRPRRAERAVPADLEIIVLKAMEKRPQDRYATSQALADDLERWLKHEPIHARRPTLLQRASKWVRRHKPAAAASVAVLLMALVLAGYIAWTRHDRTVRRKASETVVRAALEDSDNRQRQGRLPEAMSAVRRADGMSAAVDVEESLRQQVRARLADLELLDSLENVRLETRAAVRDGHFDNEGADALYDRLFREAGLDVEALSAEEVATRIRASTVSHELAAMLDDWCMARRSVSGIDHPGWKVLLRIARRVEPDVWQARVRVAFERGDLKALRELAASEEVFRLSPATLNLLGSALLDDKVNLDRVEVFLRESQRRYPDDLWLNFILFRLYFVTKQPRQPEEALRFAAVVVALRPESPGTHSNLGCVLLAKDRQDEAIAEHREAIRLKKDYATAHHNLGFALCVKGQRKEGIAAYREALRLKNDIAETHFNLGIALCDEGQRDEGIAEYREAIRLKKDYAKAHYNLGVMLGQTGHRDEAIDEYREAIRYKEDKAEAHNNLGILLRHKGQLNEAIAEYRKAIQYKEDYAEAHNNLGMALGLNGQRDEAIDEFRVAIRLNRNFAQAYINLGEDLLRQGQIRLAVEELRRGHELGSRQPGWPYLSELAARLGYAEGLAALEPRLPALLNGQEQPKDVRERVALALLCQHKKLFAASARFYSEAFAKEPKLVDNLGQHRYSAACAAALAGCGQGKDANQLDANERARLRQQALDWLRADLKAYRQVMEKSTGKAGPAIAQRMQDWLRDDDFAGVRGDEALAKLPEGERPKWRKLWEEVEALRKSAVGKAATASPAPGSDKR